MSTLKREALSGLKPFESKGLPWYAASWDTAGQENNLNFLRLFLATAVIFSHASQTLYGPSHLDPVGLALHNQPDDTFGTIIDSGHLAVDGFFIISGFLISMSWSRNPKLIDYLQKRVLRIYPGFLAAMFLAVFLFGTLGADDIRSYWFGVCQHPLSTLGRTLNLTVDWTRPPFTGTLEHVPIPHVVDGPLWTIRYEFLCYLMVALLGLAWTRLSRSLPSAWLRAAPAALFLAIYAVYVARLYHHFGRWYDLDTWPVTAWVLGGAEMIPRLFTFFIAGMCFYAYRRHVTFTGPHLLAALAILVASAFIPRGFSIMLPLVAGYVVLAVGFAPWLKLNWVGRRNDLSYGMYLYALPVQQLLVMYAGRHLTPMSAFVAALPPTLLFAWLSWKLVEKPAQRLKCPGARHQTGRSPQLLGNS